MASMTHNYEFYKEVSLDEVLQIFRIWELVLFQNVLIDAILVLGDPIHWFFIKPLIVHLSWWPQIKLDPFFLHMNYSPLTGHAKGSCLVLHRRDIPTLKFESYIPSFLYDINISNQGDRSISSKGCHVVIKNRKLNAQEIHLKSISWHRYHLEFIYRQHLEFISRHPLLPVLSVSTCTITFGFHFLLSVIFFNL